MTHTRVLLSRTALQFLTIGSLLLLESCRSSSITVDPQHDANIIGQEYQAFVEGFSRATSPEEAASVYVEHHTEDAVLMFPGAPPVTGSEQIQKYILDFSRAYRFEFPDWQTDNLWVSGDLAVHRFHGTGILTPRAGGEPTRRDSKYVDVWRRGADGHWRIAVHIFNNKS